MAERVEPGRRPLLVGFVDTEAGRDALALGAALAELLDAELVVAEAVPVPRGLLGRERLRREAEAAAAARLEAADRALGETPARYLPLLAESAPHGLHELAEREAAAAVVVGSTHRGTIGRVLPGSTGERLLQGAACPVAVAARGLGAESPPPRLLRVAVAYDGSPEAIEALELAARLAERGNANLTLLAVADPPSLPYALGTGATVSEQDPTLGERHMRRALDDAYDRLPSELPAHSRIVYGAPGQALVEASAEHDLIVVGSRGYGPLRRTLLGSTSRRLFNAAHCSVLAVPRGGEA